MAKVLGSTIYCDPRKKGILLCETDPELHAMLSSDPIAVRRDYQVLTMSQYRCSSPSQSQVHLLPLGNIQLDRLQDYLVRLHPHFDRVLGFRPTGWSYSPPAGTDMLPDVNMVIKRDQSRTFTYAGLQPQRGSCKQFMMYGEHLSHSYRCNTFVLKSDWCQVCRTLNTRVSSNSPALRSRFPAPISG